MCIHVHTWLTGFHVGFSAGGEETIEKRIVRLNLKILGPEQGFIQGLGGGKLGLSPPPQAKNPV